MMKWHGNVTFAIHTHTPLGRRISSRQRTDRLCFPKLGFLEAAGQAPQWRSTNWVCRKGVHEGGQGLPGYYPSDMMT